LRPQIAENRENRGPTSRMLFRIVFAPEGHLQEVEPERLIFDERVADSSNGEIFR
jgi:hypothetical protein